MSVRNQNQRIFVIVFGVLFIASTIAMALSSIWQNPPQSVSEKTANTTDNKTQLEAQARGYETVLAREPENTVALQGLIQTRIKMEDFQGALPHMKKLVKIYPQEKQLQELLTVIEQKASEQKEIGK